MSHRGYRRIFVCIFSLINICSSLSDEANKMKPLNIEREWQFQLSLKIWSRFSEWFPRNSLLKTRNFTIRMYESVTFFATQQFRSSWWLIIISFNIACKELKIAQIAQVNQLFQLLNLVRIYGRDCELKCTLITKNVNNDVSKGSPIG